RTSASASAMRRAVTSLMGHLRHARQQRLGHGLAAELARLARALEARGRHDLRRLEDALPEARERFLVEHELHALAVELAAHARLDEHELGAAGAVLTVGCEELVEHALAIGELIGRELR